MHQRLDTGFRLRPPARGAGRLSNPTRPTTPRFKSNLSATRRIRRLPI